MAPDLQKYKQESKKIGDGPPVCYQLQLQRVNLDKEGDEKSKLRRFTLGRRDPNRPNRTVLLVGATGAGKSTLINALVNFVMGVKFEDKVWFEIIPAEKHRSQTESQTSAVSVYEIFGFEGKTVPFSLTIIDTPGFGDTRGIDYDDVITKNLQELFSVSDGVDTIDAVGLVLKATENRLDGRMAYIFNSVTSLFGKDMEQHIVAMMTHSDGRKPINALKALDDVKVKCARDKNEPVFFSFNNCQNERIIDEELLAARFAFEASNIGMTKFTEFLDKAKSQSVRETVKVMENREQLTACIQNLKERVTTMELQQQTIRKNEEELSKYKKQMENNENFDIETEEVYKEVKPIHHWKKDKAVTCERCKENCHHPCGTWKLSWCDVMTDGKCTSCAGRCSVDRHVREKFIYVTKKRTVKTTHKDMKARYEENKKGKEKQSTLLEDMKFEMLALQQKKSQCLDEAFRYLEKLEEISLNKDSVSTHEHLDFLIEKMTEKNDTGKVNKLVRMKTRIEVDEKNKAGIQYFMGQRR